MPWRDLRLRSKEEITRSVNACHGKRPCDAPSASLSEIYERSAVRRANRKFAPFAQAISRTSEDKLINRNGPSRYVMLIKPGSPPALVSGTNGSSMSLRFFAPQMRTSQSVKPALSL
jgi:hypothetical protein